MDFPLRDSTIEEILEHEHREEETVTETEDHEKCSEHDSKTEKDVDFDDGSDIHFHYEQDEEPTSAVQLDKNYLEDVAEPKAVRAKVTCGQQRLFFCFLL